MSKIHLREIEASSVITPPVGQGTLFIDQADKRLKVKYDNDETEILNNTLRKHTEQVGDGGETNWLVVHNFNTRSVIVQIFKTDSPYTEASGTVILVPNENTVQVIFPTDIGLNEYEVTVIG